MAGVNKAILIGNLGKDPELRHTKAGQPVATFSLATNDRWTDKSGQSQERTEWHRIICWDKTAENVVRYLTKGRSVYVEGRIQSREYEGKDGVKRRITEIVASKITFLGNREDVAGNRPGNSPKELGAQGQSSGSSSSGSSSSWDAPLPDDDIIGF